jgi:hypothetical protein
MRKQGTGNREQGIATRPCGFEILTMKVWVPEVSRLRPGRLPIHTVAALDVLIDEPAVKR